MHITPLGRMAGMPLEGQASSGYLIHHGDDVLMLDAGPGTAVALSRQLPDIGLSGVFISHRHTDHLLDLLPLGKMLLRRRLITDPGTGLVEIDDRVPRVPLLVPAGTAELLHRFAALFPVVSDPLLDRSFELAFDVREYTPGETFDLGVLSLRPHLLRHVVPNCGVRVEADGLVVAYSGDTGPTPALSALAERADLLLCESTLTQPDHSGHGHLTAMDAGRAAAEAAVGALVLTHFTTTDPLDHARHRVRAAAAFDGPVDIARIGTPLPVISRKALA